MIKSIPCVDVFIVFANESMVKRVKWQSNKEFIQNAKAIRISEVQIV